MYQKMIVSGSLVEIIKYEKLPKTGLRSSKKFTKRVLNLTPKRRSDNLLSTKRHFVRRVSAAIKEFGTPLFITLTFAQNITDMDESIKEFRAFTLRMRSRFNDFQYVAVPEFQKRGALHFHCFVWGLSQERGDLRRGRITLERGTERDSREIAKIWNNGFVDIARSDGSLRHIMYFAKYMIKAASDERLVTRKLYYMSRGIPMPLIIRDDNVAFFQTKMLLMKKISESCFRSAWLGVIKKETYVR